MRKLQQRQSILLLLGFGLFVMIFFGIIMFHQLKHGDFPAHIAWAKEFSTIGYLYKFPHTLFPRFVTIIRALLPANILVWVSPFLKQVYDLKSYEISTLILMTIAYLSTGLIIFSRYIKQWEANTNKLQLFTAAAAFAVLVVGPIFIFTYPDRMFLGYITGNRFDSPTYILSKPFVLLMFIVIADNILGKWNTKQALLMLAAVLCATLAKPSFTITIIPTIGFVILLHLRNIRKVNWLFVLFPLGLTSAIVLFLQFFINYVGARGDRIIIAPFMSILYYVPNHFLVFLFSVLSIVFPLIIAVYNWKDIKSTPIFQLAWINFAVSMIYAFVFAEEINLSVNNFWNSPMIAVFLLFFVSIGYWGKGVLEKIRQGLKLSNPQVVSSLVLAVHILCGITYYFHTLFSVSVMVN